MLHSYGKKSFTASPQRMLRRLGELAQERAGRAAARGWLVFAGQIEQAVLDGGGPGGDAAARVTDAAARLLLGADDGTAVSSAAQAALRAAIAAAVIAVAAQPAEVRIPEGFAWYALSPEAYAAAAERWCAARWRGEAVTVIGLRSIGTALGAVVAAALARRGVAVTRLALRPRGHPFDRRADVPGIAAGCSVLVVDEGPGLSGSSMAGVAEDLVAQGVDAEAIAFLPGHGKGPGVMASPAVHRWWTPGRCWVGAPPADAHPAPSPLAWRFGGLAAVREDLATLAQQKAARQARMAARGWALPCALSPDGWLGFATPGTALTKQAAGSATLRQHLPAYVLDAALPPDAGAVAAGLGRIGAAIVAPQLVARVNAACAGLCLAGDGRLQPDAWRQCSDGRLRKCDATGTDCEHSWAGAQSLLWDVAGLLAEWQFDATARQQLLAGLAARGIAAAPLALAFHEAGYCCLQAAYAAQDGDDGRRMQFAALLAGARQRLAAAA